MAFDFQLALLPAAILVIVDALIVLVQPFKKNIIGRIESISSSQYCK